MHLHLTPLMVGALAAAVPAIPAASQAAEIGQVDVSDPLGATQRTLADGSTVTYTGTGTAVNVSVQGNALQGNDISITAGGAASPNTVGVKASLGGTVHLTKSSVKTLGAGQGAHALYATGAGSVISATDTEISTAGSYSHGAYALSGGKVALEGGSVAVAGTGSSGLQVDGENSIATAKSLDIKARGAGASAVNVVNGGRAELVNVTATSGNSVTLSVRGVGSTLWIQDTDLVSTGSGGIRVDSAALTMQGGSITSASDAVTLVASAGLDGGSAIISNATLSTTGGYGVNINAAGSSATLDNVTISTRSAWASGIWLPSINTSLVARNLVIDSTHVGIDNRAGQVTLDGGSVETHGDNAHGLYVSREYGTTATTAATGTHIKTSGAGAVGALARASGASVALTDATVDTYGASAHGLFASGTNSSITATGSAVTTRGADAVGLNMSNRTSVALDNTQLSTSGDRAHGVWSYTTAAGLTNNLLLANGTQVDTLDGTGLLASGGNHNFTLRNAQVTARTGGDDNHGVFLQTRAANVTSGGVTTVVQTGQVTVDATGSVMTGDVLADSGTVDIDLKSASVLTGAVVSRAGRVNSLSLDNASAWNVRGDSILGTLNNTGTVRFVAPDAQSGFKTLTVNDYAGGGTLVMNTRLGGDGSPTDKLVIDGGTTSGVTGMRILNAGGSGGQTVQGIRLVEAINGGTTTPDAFRLDSGSTGFRASSGTIAANGYDYSLVRGGDNGVASDWYLTSVYTPGSIPEPPGGIVPPYGPRFINVSPESGAYIGNQLAAERMFMHGLNDRSAARVPSGGESPDRTGRDLWLRAKGTRNNGLRMTEGKVDVDTDSSILQIGGDVLQALLGQDGLFIAGVMAGYGDARVRSTSRLMTADQNLAVSADARGKVTGYSAGVYATAYANDATRLGAYADSWLQYGRYSNQIDSEPGSARYRSNTWTASVETGYAFLPFAPDSALAAMVVEPQVQLAYSRYDAKDAVLPGMRLESGSAGAVNTRAGVRVYPLGKPAADTAVRPYIETNWLHGAGNPRVDIAAGSFSAVPLRNAAELKVGAEGRVGKAWHVSGQVSGQTGSGDQRGYGGMLNLTYRW
ncbi:autotransporter outer membrane beta-barrel domain-containing protein [Achromobacter deleyi]|uniref:autotransporter family protein n=1 Tax=Achromobacter deleyi TaxID=1353891 RepID=UPI001492874B|nr:autotransporter outer membrane beta-barrel domain-containing protein [Achromobacter deleyi]QVQ28187.1 autotransporter outer membrane beta-barrel domain-containing protein [Achromobacter deleyi]UIP18376.1 autotransporter outer membrane beta-barrel domain-containing protein [Achromobacter deleyi]